MTGDASPAAGGAGAEPVGREVVFEDLCNVRDLGGHRSRGGGRIREGHWFRGAGLHRIAGSDVAVLRSLGVRTVLDLRTSQEIVDHGAFPAAETGIEVRHLPLIPRTWPHVAEFEGREEAVAFLVERFLEMLDTGGPAIAAAVRRLAEPEPAMAYCMAGKDRTGVLTAVLLDLVGIDDADIARDFSRSELAMQRLVELSSSSGAPDATMVDQSAHVRAAPPEAMLGFLAVARARYGSLTEYVGGHGIGDADLSRLRDRLLEDRGVADTASPAG